MKKIKSCIKIILFVVAILGILGMLMVVSIRLCLVPRQVDGFGPETLQLPEFIDKYDCSIENKKIIKKRDTLSVPLIQVISGVNKDIVYTYHLMFEGKNGFETFLTYSFPFTTGIGAVAEDTQFLIEETPDNITIYHDTMLEKELGQKFNLVKSPFSKNIHIKYKSDLWKNKGKPGTCYKGLEYP